MEDICISFIILNAQRVSLFISIRLFFCFLFLLFRFDIVSIFQMTHASVLNIKYIYTVGKPVKAGLTYYKSVVTLPLLHHHHY